MTTGKDNQTHDVVRVGMAAVIVSMVAVLVLGVLVYAYGYIYSLSHPEAKWFDIQTFFNAVSTYAVAFSAFLMGGAASLFFKKTTEPDGSQTTVESVKTGPGSAGPVTETTRVTETTNINQPSL